MVEGTSAIAALGRSREHTKGSWWRLFGIGIIIISALYVAVFIASISISFFPFADTIFIAVTSVVITPIVLIGGTATYIDLRIREGYSLDDMAEEMAG